MMVRVKAWLRDVAVRFARSNSGNVAMIFGLCLVPLIAAGGVAVDMSRAMIVRHRLSEALDAAGLAAGRDFSDGLDAVKAKAQQYFNANYPTAELGVPGELQVSMEGTNITLTATASVQTTLMQVVGFDYLNVGVSSQITREGKSVEIGLALDVTGSMSGQRIIDLRAAAKELIDTVVWEEQDQFYSKVAIVPYSMGVNVGSYADQARGAATAPKAITGAVWGKSITGASWASGTAKTITGATPFTGTSKNISGITKATTAVVTANGHGLSNGDVIWISGVNGMTQVNNKYFTVANKTTNTFQLQGTNSSFYSTYSSGGTIKTCQVGGCEPVITANAHGFSNGNTVYVTGVGGMTQINDTIFTVANATTNTFSLSGVNGGTYSTYTSGGSATKCATTNCNIVITSTSHGFASGNTAHIDGVGGMTQLNGNNYTIANVTTNTFSLNSTTGPSMSTYTSGGRVCSTTNCPVTITANGHGFSNGNYVYISGVGGMTQINDTSFTVANASTNTFDLSGINGSTYSTYTSGGSVYCVTAGCQYYRFTNPSGGTKTFQISNCVTERTGTNSYTDVAPSTTYVGRNYPSTNNPCLTNQIIPLSTDKTYLKSQIDLLEAQGSTAGQTGLAWAWYMISPNFAYMFPSSSQGAQYSNSNVLKIAVLMTDGAFNSPYCNGVIAADAVSGSGSSSDHINCNATNGSSYSQGGLVCDGIKAAGVEVYSVGFYITGQQSAIDLMTNCASEEKADHAFLTDNGAELMAAFQAIATDISELRLSK